MRVAIVLGGTAAALVGPAGCKQAGRRHRPPVSTRVVEAHAGAQRMAGGVALLASQETRDDRPRVRISRGDRPIERTVDGWLAGVWADRTFVLVPAGDEVAVTAVTLSGEDLVLGKVPGPDRWSAPAGAVADGGAAVIVTTGEGPYLVAGANPPARLPVLEEGERVAVLVANPRGPEVFVIASRSSTLDEARWPLGARLILYDLRRRAVRWALARGRLPGGEGSAAFTAEGRLLVQVDGGVFEYAVTTGQRTRRWTGPSGVDSGGVFDDTGSRFAFGDWIGRGHAALSDETCVTSYFDDQIARQQSWAIEVSSAPDCPALLFVADQLWLSPEPSAAGR